MPVTIEHLRQAFRQLDESTEVAEFYDRFPRNEWWNDENRSCSVRILNEARDVEDMIRKMQATHLFGVNADSASRDLAIRWLVTQFNACGIEVDALPPALEESPVSEPGISTYRKGRRLSIDFLRTVSAGHDVQRYFGSAAPLDVLELGGGLGHLARTLRLMRLSKSHLIFDLPESLVFSCAFLTTNFPDCSYIFVTNRDQLRDLRPRDYDFAFVPSCFAESTDVSHAELFVNTASLGEMRNETIRYWMNFVQRSTPVTYLFTQNRFLNTMDPDLHGWRWAENEASVHYDSSWTILKWDLEPTWFRCPYVVPVAARHLDLAATRVSRRTSQENAVRARELLAEVRAEDWFRFVDRPQFMTTLQNAFVTDVTMTGALFKLWESIRLDVTSEAVSTLLQYLERFRSSASIVFEETRYYRQLLTRLSDPHSLDATASHPPADDPGREAHRITLVGETDDYNIVEVEKMSLAGRAVSFYALAKRLGPLHLFQERVGEREFYPHVLIGETREAVVDRARAVNANG